LTERGREALADERARREGWLARTIATELTDDEQELLMQTVPLLRRLAQG
jgi:hypothetical protein